MWFALFLSVFNSDFAHAQELFKTKTAPAHPPAKVERASFAAGCFWGVEEEFRKQKGVLATAVGFMGGHTKNPAYEEVSGDHTGHAETVTLDFDPKVVSYTELLDVFWHLHDPTTLNRQGPDEGSQYRSVIFYYSPAQKAAAIKTRDELQKAGEFSEKIVTEIVPSGPFTLADAHHQQYVEKGGRAGCHLRRKKISAVTPPTPRQAELRKTLSEETYRVTQEDATEQPFLNKYWDNHEAGIYVDAVSGDPLFSSKDKFDSGTGWPSFSRPIKQELLVQKSDRALGMDRTEVRSKRANSHLGHVFTDGPGPDKMRYCINSASLRFIPVNKLKEEGYSEYLPMFKTERSANIH